MKRRALLIGINEYYLLGKLNYARQDAEATAEALRRHCGFADHEITLMSCRGEAATRGLSRFIERALENLAQCRDLDLLVFGFWGHGFSPDPGHRYLCGMDTEEIDLQRTAVSLDVVKARLAQVQAENTLLVLDCCQNQPTGRSASSQVMTEGEEIALASLARDIQAAHREDSRYSISTVAVLNACREGQRAYEWESRGHGVFTAHLLDGFQQGFGGVASLAAWTADRVPRTTMDMLGQVQTPYITIEGKGDITLPAIRAATAAVAPVAEQESRPREVLKEPVLRVETTPAGATVSIDGRGRGMSPVELPLPAGKYRLRVELKGYTAVERAIRYDTAGDARLQIAMRERPLSESFFPMTAEQAKEVQTAAAKASGLPVEITNSIGMKLRLIPAGEFMMGSPESEKDRHSHEGPQHRVQITRPFFLGVYQVTQGEYERMMGKNPSCFIATPELPRPAECVRWDDAKEFCRRLSAVEGQSYSLPTEAQWEYACRAGTTTPFHFGNVLNGRQANCDGNRPYGTSEKGLYLNRTTTVGSYSTNGFGLYDMHGNVWELCEDWYGAKYYATSPLDDPQGPSSGSDRVLRGGSWSGSAGYCRSALRYWVRPSLGLNRAGFRVALAPADESASQ